jgi:hypothetical protein
MVEQTRPPTADGAGTAFVQSVTGPQFAEWAYDFACSKLDHRDPGRWEHAQAGVALARRIAPTVGDDANLLLGIVALHDIGKSPELIQTGFSPLDGAIFLDRLGAPRAAMLVANLAGSGIEARLRGFDREYEQFPDESSAVRDALWYCCLTRGIAGEQMTLDDRLVEISKRYADDPIVAQWCVEAEPTLRKAIARTEVRIMKLNLE